MGYVDFTTYSKDQDVNNAISFTTTRCTFTTFHRREDAWSYYDYGAGYFTDFTHFFELRIDSIDPTGGVYAKRIMVASLAENSPLDNWYANESNGAQVGINIEANGTADQFDLLAYRSLGTTSYEGTVISGLSTGVTYYLKWIKSGGMNLTVEVYSDEARTVLVGSSTYSDGTDNNFRFLMPIQALTNGTNEYETTGYVQNYALVPFGTNDLYAKVFVPFRGTADLKAEFLLRQETENLKAEFIVKQWQEDLFASFWTPIDGSVELKAVFEVDQENASTNLFCKFGVRQIYDLSDNDGIGFFWEGVGRGHVDILILTPTGGWIGKFPDWGQKTWVSLLFDGDLQEVDIDGSRPDKSQITGLLWTYHSDGIRNMDGIYGLPKGGDPDIFAKFLPRHAGAEDLHAEFFRNHFREDLLAIMKIRQSQPGRGPTVTTEGIGLAAPYNYGSTSYPVYSLTAGQGQKSINALGRHWVFYAEGELVDDSTRDLAFISGKGGVWTSKTLIADATLIYGGSFVNDYYAPWAVHFDGTYIHLSYFNGTTDGDLNYKRGTPAADGTIVWDAEQIVTSGDEYYQHAISTDVNGYPFIAYCRNFEGAHVVNSSTKDGTWTTDVNLQYDTSNDQHWAELHALSDGTMIMLHYDDGTAWDEWTWNGSSWTKTATLADMHEHWTAAVDTDDVIHLAYHDSTLDKIQYRKREADGTWTDFVDLASGITKATQPNITVGYGSQDQNELVIIYFVDATLYYIRYHDGAWLTPEVLVTLPYDIANRLLSTPRSYTGGRVAVFTQTQEFTAGYPEFTGGTLWAVNMRIYNAPELKAEFIVLQGNEDLKATFVVGQGSENLFTRFKVEPNKNLKAQFTLRHSVPGTPDMLGDPTSVAVTAPWNYGNTSYPVYAVAGPWGRKSFDAVGRNWVFIGEGEFVDDSTRKMAFVSQKNGVWSSKTYVDNATLIYGGTTVSSADLYAPWAVHFDGTYVHLTFFNGTSNGNLIYVRGTPAADGTIAWDAQQTVTSGDEYYQLCILTDVNGYPFIAYCRDFIGAYIVNSSTKDGTWTTDVSYEYDTSNDQHWATLHALSDGTMVLLHYDDGTAWDEWTWDGASWTKNITLPSMHEFWSAAVDANDVIHLAYYDTSADKLQYRKRAADGTWTDFVDLVTGLSETTNPQITVGYGWQDQGDLLILYHQGAVLYYIRYRGGVWLAPEAVTLPYDTSRRLATPPRYTGGRIIMYAQTHEFDGEWPDFNGGTLWSVSLKTYDAPEIKSEFVVAQGNEDLKAEFIVRYGSENLFADFWVMFDIEKDLYARFKIEPHKDLKAIFNVAQGIADLKAEFTVASTQDLTTFTEEDPGGQISVTADRATVTNFSRQEESKLYKDFGTDYFDDFTHEFEYRLESNDVYAWWVIWGVSNDPNDVAEVIGREYLVRVGSGVSSNDNNLYLYEYYNGAVLNSDDNQSDLSRNVTYYLRVIKSGTALSCEIYSDPDRTTLIDTLSITVSNTSMRYLFAVQSLNSGNARLTSGWSQLYSLR